MHSKSVSSLITLFMTLFPVPFIYHHERENDVCCYQSWRARGWCRVVRTSQLFFSNANVKMWSVCVCNQTGIHRKRACHAQSAGYGVQRRGCYPRVCCSESRCEVACWKRRIHVHMEMHVIFSSWLSRFVGAVKLTIISTEQVLGVPLAIR